MTMLKQYGLRNTPHNPTENEFVTVKRSGKLSNRFLRVLGNSDYTLSSNILKASFSMYFMKKTLSIYLMAERSQMTKTDYHFQLKTALCDEELQNCSLGRIFLRLWWKVAKNDSNYSKE